MMASTLTICKRWLAAHDNKLHMESNYKNLQKEADDEIRLKVQGTYSKVSSRSTWRWSKRVMSTIAAPCVNDNWHEKVPKRRVA